MRRRNQNHQQAPRNATPAHDFHDPGYARRWTAHANARNPVRRDFVACMAARAAVLVPPRPVILEYGCGPGFLAERLLADIDVWDYWLIDFSQPMLDLCASRLRRFGATTRFVKRDFTRSDWLSDLSCRPNLVVSMQASHEVRSKSKTGRLYKQILRVLEPGGGFLMCDLIADRVQRDRSVFLTLAEHVELLRGAGFESVAPLLRKGGLGLSAAFRPSR